MSVSSTGQILPAGIEYLAAGEADELRWSCWRLKKDWGYLGCLSFWWIGWNLGTVVFTYIAWAYMFSSDRLGDAIAACIFLPFFWLVSLLSLGCVAALFAHERVCIADDRIVLELNMWIYWRCKVLPRQAVRGLSLEFYDDGFEAESVATLNLWKSGVIFNREILAYYVATPVKAALFQQLRSLLEKRHWSIELCCRLPGNSPALG
jgi:hypothetical protein